jgi:hypothetical protein
VIEYLSYRLIDITLLARRYESAMLDDDRLLLLALCAGDLSLIVGVRLVIEIDAIAAR